MRSTRMASSADPPVAAAACGSCPSVAVPRSHTTAAASTTIAARFFTARSFFSCPGGYGESLEGGRPPSQVRYDQPRERVPPRSRPPPPEPRGRACALSGGAPALARRVRGLAKEPPRGRPDELDGEVAGRPPDRARARAGGAA